MGASDRYDVLGIGAHPDDLEVVIGGTAAKLVARGLRVLFVDLCAGEPARHAIRGERAEEARRAAEILQVERTALGFQDRLIADSAEARIAVARLIRQHRPRLVFTTEGCGVHPDHKAVTDIVTNGVFYARLPKWDEVKGGEGLAGTAPHEIERLFFAHCRMETPWDRFDFAVDISAEYDRKLEALACYRSVFGAGPSELRERFDAEDRYVGSLVGVRYAEAFRARRPLLVTDPTVFLRVPHG